MCASAPPVRRNGIPFAGPIPTLGASGYAPDTPELATVRPPAAACDGAMTSGRHRCQGPVNADSAGT